MSFVHEGLAAFIIERRKEEKRYTNEEKLSTKTMNFSEFLKLKEVKPVQSLHFPLVNSTHSNVVVDVFPMDVWYDAFVLDVW